MKREKRAELYLLFAAGLKPVDILEKWPDYSEGTVYKYYREFKAAKEKVRHLIQMLSKSKKSQQAAEIATTHV